MADTGYPVPLPHGRRPRRLGLSTRALGVLAVLGALAWSAGNGALLKVLDTPPPFAAASARGTLIVAVPPRPAPTLYVGHVDRSIRAPDPFSAALAADLGHRLKLPVEFVLAAPSEARAAVQMGKADVAIAGLAFSPDASLAFAPTAYTSGRGQALVLRHGNVRNWHDLRGQAVCAPSGSPFAARAAHAYGVTIQSYDRPLDALLAFQAGECAALVEDERVVRALLKQPDWSYYQPLSGTLDAAPAFIATRGGDVASAVFVNDVVADWRQRRWLSAARQSQAVNLAFDVFNAENDLYCH